MPHVRPRRRLAVTLAALTLAIALVTWLVLQHTGRRTKHRMSRPVEFTAQQLQPLLAPVPSMPLSAAETDVLVALVCTFRKDRLQPYGLDSPTTPFLQQLSEHGALFERTIVQSSWTRPSMGSLLTGRWTRSLQLDDPSDRPMLDLALSPEQQTLAEAMNGHGFRTLGASGNPNVSSVFGFDQGFDVHHEPRNLWRDASSPPPSGLVLTEQLLRELDKVPTDERVFLQAFFVDTHAPRRPSVKARRAVARGKDTRDASQRVRQYDAALHTLDSYLAQLWSEVKKRRPNLLFVVIGDHGEGLYLPRSHGKGHGNQLYTTTTDVPFLWQHPSLPQNRRIGGLAMGLDLFPTLLDLLGLPIPRRCDGASQAAALRGTAKSSSHQLAHSETMFRKSFKTAIFADGYQLIRDHRAVSSNDEPRQSLYRLEEALQQRELTPDKPDVVTSLAGALDDWEADMEASLKDLGAPLTSEPSSDDLERLRILGYVE